jgi:hypothetical protein
MGKTTARDVVSSIVSRRRLRTLIDSPGVTNIIRPSGCRAHELGPNEPNMCEMIPLCCTHRHRTKDRPVCLVTEELVVLVDWSNDTVALNIMFKRVLKQLVLTIK